MTIALIIGAIALICFGIYRVSQDHRNEGLAEIFFGLLEVIAEVIAAVL